VFSFLVEKLLDGFLIFRFKMRSIPTDNIKVRRYG